LVEKNRGEKVPKPLHYVYSLRLFVIGCALNMRLEMHLEAPSEPFGPKLEQIARYYHEALNAVNCGQPADHAFNTAEVLFASYRAKWVREVREKEARDAKTARVAKAKATHTSKLVHSVAFSDKSARKNMFALLSE
jgi:hypothetical protein